MTDEWKNKSWYIHTMDYYSVQGKKKRKSSLINTIWINLKKQLWMEEVGPKRKDCMLHIAFIWNCRKWNSIVTSNKQVGKKEEREGRPGRDYKGAWGNFQRLMEMFILLLGLNWMPLETCTLNICKVFVCQLYCIQSASKNK